MNITSKIKIFSTFQGLVFCFMIALLQLLSPAVYAQNTPLTKEDSIGIVDSTTTSANSTTPVVVALPQPPIAEEADGLYGLGWGVSALLVLSLLIAFAFEFINGFHDTANAVATVIYTNALKPQTAVVWSGFCNFLGVLWGSMGGLAVAMSIVYLLPVELLIDQNIGHSLAMVYAMLFSAIVWNLGTWYFGLPASSSHTLIGSILGIGLGYSFLPENVTGQTAVNWTKATDIGLSLLFSPFFGFMMTILLMLVLRFIYRTPKKRRKEMMERGMTAEQIEAENMQSVNIFKSPKEGQTPPFWTKITLWTTCTLVSFFHGNNDGQKGIGLVMLILVGVAPTYFALNEGADTAKDLKYISEIQAVMSKMTPPQLGEKERALYDKMTINLADLSAKLQANPNIATLPRNERNSIRKNLLLAESNAKKLLKSENIKGVITKVESEKVTKTFKSVKGDLVDYAPWWVAICISLALGIGTMVGWKRIVVTIGEKIGKEHLSYAQGASAELVAATTIGLASSFGLPVSTTHVLSSGIAGSMVASKGVKNLNKGTARNILLAWVLTLPVTMAMSAMLFILFRYMF